MMYTRVNQNEDLVPIDEMLNHSNDDGKKQPLDMAFCLPRNEDPRHRLSSGGIYQRVHSRIAVLGTWSPILIKAGTTSDNDGTEHMDKTVSSPLNYMTSSLSSS